MRRTLFGLAATAVLSACGSSSAAPGVDEFKLALETKLQKLKPQGF